MAPDGRGQEGLPGSAEPRRRLPVTPSAPGAPRLSLRRLARPGGLRFPLGAPTWPGGIARPPLERTLGVDYDSDWARRYPARLARAVVQEAVSRPLVNLVARPTVTGLDRIAHLDEPVIFAANHASHVDAPLILSVIPERWRRDMFVAGAADYFFDTRLKATVFAFLLNAVPIERQKVSRESAARVEELLDDGWSLLIFPEGGRSPDGWGQEHRAGAAWLATRAGRAIVPIHVRGTHDILPKGGKAFRPGTTEVAFGKPLRPSTGGKPSDARALAERLESAIAALADEQASDWWTARRRAASSTTPALRGPEASAWRRSWALGSRDDRSVRRSEPGGSAGGRRSSGGAPGWPTTRRRRR